MKSVSERLVLLSDAQSAPAGTKVLAQAGRIAVCELPAGADPPGESIDPDALPEDLTEAERLFAESWHSSRSRAPKDRKGDGLPWDAAGFQPPDGDPRRG